MVLFQFALGWAISVNSSEHAPDAPGLFGWTFQGDGPFFFFPGWPGWPVVGAAAVGALVFAAILMRRCSDFLVAGRGINALCYLSPMLALAVLAVSGFDVRRFDLFLVGVLVTLIGGILLRDSQNRPIRTYAFAG